MKPIEPPDKHHLLAAQGWLELGNNGEAFKELDLLAPELKTHPEVLRLRWRVCAKTKNLDSALEIAQALFQHNPNDLLGSMPTDRLKFAQPESGRRLAEALEIGFPLFFAIPYNLACYSCQAGNLNEAWEWFQIASEMVDLNELYKLALKDPDLEPLWPKILDI